MVEIPQEPVGRYWGHHSHVFYYIVCILFAEFFSPYSKALESDYIEARAQLSSSFLTWKGIFSLRPYVNGLKKEIDLETRSRTFVIDETVKYPIYFFVKGEPYKVSGIKSPPTSTSLAQTPLTRMPRFF